MSADERAAGFHITFGRWQKQSFPAVVNFDQTVGGLRKPTAYGTQRYPFKGHGKKQFQQIAPDLGSSARYIQRRLSKCVSVDAMQSTGQKTSQMWNYFLLGPKLKPATAGN
jgi:hypothetical protein